MRQAREICLGLRWARADDAVQMGPKPGFESARGGFEMTAFRPRGFSTLVLVSMCLAAGPAPSEEIMPTRTARASWQGGLKGGTGKFDGESGAIKGAYSFRTRFEQEPGSNPEELLAAAEAACFSMALAAEIERSGKTPTSVETQARCTIERVGEGFKITTMKLSVRATVPGLEERQLVEIAEKVKTTCPVSVALKGNVALELEAKLA